MNPFLSKVFPEGKKAVNFDRMSAWTIVGLIPRLHQNSFFGEILSLLFLTHYAVLTQHNST
jgi:hypothetical protein